jgi:hypothetical protein
MVNNNIFIKLIINLLILFLALNYGEILHIIFGYNYIKIVKKNFFNKNNILSFKRI